MKVSDIMQKSVIKVAPTDPIRDVARLIFSLGVSGVPVAEGEKLVGIVTEQDIFKKIRPSLLKPSGKNHVAESLLDSPVSKIMSRDVKTVSPESPVMKAQTIMFLNHFTTLPVVNNQQELLGVVSEQDVFKEIIKKKVPQMEIERYAEFIAHHYDSIINWEERIAMEMPPLFATLKKHNVKKILDLGSWTGQFAIELAKGVPEVLAIDHRAPMINLSNVKLKKMSGEVTKRLKFQLTDFDKLDEEVVETYDAVVASGNSLPYLPLQAHLLLPKLAKKLRKKNAVMIIQLVNFEKVLSKNEGLLSFGVQRVKDSSEKEHMFIQFLDKTDSKDRSLRHAVIFDNDGQNWVFKGIITVTVFNYTRVDIEKGLRAAGFNKIVVTGNKGSYGLISSTAPFDPKESDWINIIATRE